MRNILRACKTLSGLLRGTKNQAVAPVSATAPLHRFCQTVPRESRTRACSHMGPTRRNFPVTRTLPDKVFARKSTQQSALGIQPASHFVKNGPYLGHGQELEKISESPPTMLQSFSQKYVRSEC